MKTPPLQPSRHHRPRRRFLPALVALLFSCGSGTAGTRVTIEETRWLINGQPTHPGTPAEGLLMNARMDNANFEDRSRAEFDAEANRLAKATAPGLLVTSSGYGKGKIDAEVAEAFDFLPWAQPLSDPRKAGITVRQLLNHSTRRYFPTAGNFRPATIPRAAAAGPASPPTPVRSPAPAASCSPSSPASTSSLPAGPAPAGIGNSKSSSAAPARR